MEHELTLYEHAVEMARQGLPWAMAVVVEAKGSTPQKPGAKALLSSDGVQYGTIGGGLVESQVLDAMRECMESGSAGVETYRLDEEYSREAGPICGGYMRIAVIGGSEASATAARDALSAHRAGERGLISLALADDDATYGRLVWNAENGGLSKSFAEALRRETATILDSDDQTVPVFVEPVCSRPRLLVVGGGHVGQEVVFQAHRLGFAVTVVDDRAEFATPDRFPDGVESVAGNIRDTVSAFPKGMDAHIVLVSKGHRPDAEALEACIDEPLAYLGMIGSARKIRMLREDFLRRGLATAETFDRVAAPIGIDIGALSVQEIGVAIAGQLVAARRLGMPLPRGLQMPRPVAEPTPAPSPK